MKKIYIVRLLADKIVELEIAPKTSRSTVWRTLKKQDRAVEAWATACNENLKGIQWHFNVEKARAKLKSLYPIIK